MQTRIMMLGVLLLCATACGPTEDSAESDDMGSGGESLDAIRAGEFVTTRGQCDIDTGFAGDDACLLPPDPSEGFQIHVGPDDYTNQDDLDEFLIPPGADFSECYMKKTGNEEDVFWWGFEVSGRPGTHHIINTLVSEDRPDGWGSCTLFTDRTGVRIGGLGGASRAYIPLKSPAPENEGLGIPLAARTQGQFDMHYFNPTDVPVLREFWINVYYIDEKDVTQRPSSITGLGGVTWFFAPIRPGTHRTYTFSAPIENDGRITALWGHTHSHALMETAWIVSGGERRKVFEQFDYLSPEIFSYDSVTENPDLTGEDAGAVSGILEVKAGDLLEWECEINNDSDVSLDYGNNVTTGEMCNIWGQTVDAGPITFTGGL